MVRATNQTASSSATPTEDRNSTIRVNKRRTEGNKNILTEEALMERMTEVLQNTLPSMLKTMLGDRFKDPEEEKEVSKHQEKSVTDSQATVRIESSRDIGNPSKQGEEKLMTGGSNEKKEYQVKGKVCSFKTFNDTRLKEFKGTEGPVALMNWVTKMQSCFKICNCPEEQKVTYAATTLLDSALHWWETECEIRGEEGVAALTWEKMKSLMMDKYCTQSEVKKLESEFLQLEQGSSSVQEYVNEFLEKARFATYQMATVAEENNIKANGERRDAKRKWEGTSKLMKKSKGGTTHAKTRNKEFTIPQCAKCNKRHKGECWRDKVTCYRCGKPGHTSKECPESKSCYECGPSGHIRSECPKVRNGAVSDVKTLGSGPGEGSEKKKELPKAMGRAFKMTLEEARESPDVVSVLGMDWLSENQARILCYEKIVKIRTPEGKTMYVYGDRKKGSMGIITTLKANKFLRNGCATYLAYAIDFFYKTHS
ncbi:hypothetical protein OSB04_016547 [Centaurea solstitialis]|uniref:CCHC-type domain-containing protein n=1 Tax=Centaurea solstitialis TaxID=347529 RepID=A0AA38W8L0_9ASTR|nr:hypothetical protein OSB04_016547 [Centaurea solstitialis]